MPSAAVSVNKKMPAKPKANPNKVKQRFTAKELRERNKNKKLQKKAGATLLPVMKRGDGSKIEMSKKQGAAAKPLKRSSKKRDTEATIEDDDEEDDDVDSNEEPDEDGSDDEQEDDEEDSDEDPRLRWPALESNPEALTSFLHKVGVPKEWEVFDVFGFTDDLLQMIPVKNGNVGENLKAFILCYPVCDDDGNSLMPTTNRKRVKLDSDAPYFLWQGEDLGNACGAIALIHAVANTPAIVGGELDASASATTSATSSSTSCKAKPSSRASSSTTKSKTTKTASSSGSTSASTLKKNSCLRKFLVNTSALTPQERGVVLELDEKIMEKVEEVACDEEMNQTSWYKLLNDDEEDDEDGEDDSDEIDLSTEHHFVCFIEKGGVIYELDGCRNAPLKVGKCTPAGSGMGSGTGTSSRSRCSFGVECGKIIQARYLDKAPENMQFATLALGKK
mmetsp:Transcript_2944/g.6728  ORF Transcript_2944/g.6728 Transcript_2944/m.6728 type:complete len:448 (+) Transcript_2944:146-1489(+)|eukprot:CAMPEP_0178988748 /NCGR_PEP_ID=MMETSP0795-20121207/3975_1 /TAXON_ID=88552 /ORGANISM="Amoebophrya sp., Strain Ameob2" /LENGTH=447 /DNA_ID=CAMNT_0020680041 /DNA_START=122 /DNA_END=1465 /DNA_ORIENTATION=+